MIRQSGCFIFLVIFIIAIARMGFVAKEKLSEKLPQKNNTSQEQIKDEKQEQLAENIVNIAKQITEISMKESKRTTDFTSEDITKVFAEILKPDNITGNSFKIKDYGTWEFFGNGKCSEDDDCSLTVYDDNKNEIVKVPLFAKNRKYLTTEQE